MIEVFKDNMLDSSKSDIEELDEKVRVETLMYRCTQIETIGLSILCILMFILSNKFSKVHPNKILLVSILIGSILTFFYIGVSYKRKLRKIVNNNKRIILNSKEILIVNDYIYVNNVHPIKLDKKLKIKPKIK